jgi:hypothetical protein
VRRTLGGVFVIGAAQKASRGSWAVSWRVKAVGLVRQALGGIVVVHIAREVVWGLCAITWCVEATGLIRQALDDVAVVDAAQEAVRWLVRMYSDVRRSSYWCDGCWAVLLSLTRLKRPFWGLWTWFLACVHAEVPLSSRLAVMIRQVFLSEKWV